MLRIMLHKGNSYKFVSSFKHLLQIFFDETTFCKNLICVNSDQAENQVVKDSVALTPDLRDRQSYKYDRQKLTYTFL
jgi:hypothetical protein